jgi:hypothetical protein
MVRGDLEMKQESIEVAQRLEEIARLSARSGQHAPHAAKKRGRTWWTRSLDAVLFAVRHYAPPLQLSLISAGTAGNYGSLPDRH